MRICGTLNVYPIGLESVVKNNPHKSFQNESHHSIEHRHYVIEHLSVTNYLLTLEYLLPITDGISAGSEEITE